MGELAFGQDEGACVGVIRGEGRLAVGQVSHASVGQEGLAGVERLLVPIEPGRVREPGRGEGRRLGRPHVGGDREVRPGVRPGERGAVAVRERVRLEVQPAEVVAVPERVIRREGMVGPDVGPVAQHQRGHVLADVAEFGHRTFHVRGQRGFAREEFARPRPFDDAGQVGDAGMGERRTHGEIGVGAFLGESDGAELREREQRTAGDRIEDDVALAAAGVVDARTPEGAPIGRRREVVDGWVPS